jgi:hypothetical protein
MKQSKINKQNICSKEDGRSVVAAAGRRQQHGNNDRQWLWLRQLQWQPRQRRRGMAKMRSMALLMMTEMAEARATAAGMATVRVAALAVTEMRVMAAATAEARATAAKIAAERATMLTAGMVHAWVGY